MVFLFDLDGTLTNPMIGITKSVEHALNAFGIKVDRLEDLNCFIGPPLRGSFREYYNLNDEQVEQAMVLYRERYGTVGLYENEVYDGIPELLEHFKKLDVRLFVATSKPTYYSKLILEHFGLANYFEDICGCEFDGTRDSKEEVIEHLLQEKLIDREQVYMIGDTRFDMWGAKKCGIRAIGVSYGFGSEKELEDAGAYRIVANVPELSLALTAIVVNDLLAKAKGDIPKK